MADDAAMRRGPRARQPSATIPETRSGAGTLARALGWSAVAALALLPAALALRAGWIAEDASILGYVDRHGPLADWGGSQYGLHLVSFWRPLVTSVWWLGERVFGIEPSGLRLVNVIGHLAAAWLACTVARAAGASLRAALVAGALVASFPEVGGTVVWLAGRTDVLAAVAMLGALVCALRGWNLAAAAVTFAACATKEFGFLLPVWAALFLWASGVERRALARGVIAVLAATVVAFVWRRLALGSFEGGYLAATRDTAAFVQDLPRALAHLATGLWPLLVGLGVLALLGHLAGSLAPRLFAAGIAAGAVALVLLTPLARAAPLEPQNARLFFVAEAGFALAAAGALARPARRPIVYACAVALALGLVGWRSGKGVADTLEWKEAGAVAEREVSRVRTALRDAAPSDRPVLADLPRVWRGAYCLDWGAAAYFRAPFEATPRPVWPDRAMFAVSGERPRAFAPRPDGTLWPFDDPPTAPVLALRDSAGGTPVRIEIDEELVGQAEVDRSPRLFFDPPAQELGLEAAVYSEVGSHAALVDLDARSGQTSLMLVCSARDLMKVASIGDALLQAKDVGATRAFLELRLVGPTGELRAASPWVELVWELDPRAD